MFLVRNRTEDGNHSEGKLLKCIGDPTGGFDRGIKRGTTGGGGESVTSKGEEGLCF